MQTQLNGNLTIGDLVARYGVAPQSLRNWEAQGDIPPAQRTPGGHRRYSQEHVDALDRLFGMQSVPWEPTRHSILPTEGPLDVNERRETVLNRQAGDLAAIL